MLSEELGAASCIKSRVNRLSVISAITSVQQRLKLYSKVPDNGLAVFCGNITIDGTTKEKKMLFDFEPFRPVSRSLYHCDSRFHTECLEELLADEDRIGFIVMDGNGALFAAIQGNSKEILHKFAVDLPKKHGRGGQSALRFARLRLEKRHNYIRKVSETAAAIFIGNGTTLNITGLILAGSAELKTELSRSDLFDQRLQKATIKIVDVSYGGESGLNQAIELASDSLSGIKFVKEKKLISEFFDHIYQDTGKFCFGTDETLMALEMGAAETIICWDGLETQRIVLKGQGSNPHQLIKYLTPGDASELDGQDEVIESSLLLEWITENFGSSLEIVSDQTQEGAQFVNGFGGIGAILRYKVDLGELQLF